MSGIFESLDNHFEASKWELPENQCKHGTPFCYSCPDCDLELEDKIVEKGEIVNGS